MKHCFLPRGQLSLTLRGYLFTRSKLLSFARVPNLLETDLDFPIKLLQNLNGRPRKFSTRKFERPRPRKFPFEICSGMSDSEAKRPLNPPLKKGGLKSAS